MRNISDIIEWKHRNQEYYQRPVGLDEPIKIPLDVEQESSVEQEQEEQSQQEEPVEQGYEVEQEQEEQSQQEESAEQGYVERVEQKERIEKVKIEKIKIDDKRRIIDRSIVDEMAESMSRLGQLQPIMISEDYNLIFGAHRIKAAQLLGWKEIEAKIVSMSELKEKLAELDENLMRKEQHYLEKGEQFMMRKEIYEKMHPESKADVIGGLKRQNPASEIISFAKDTAKKLKISERTIQQEIQIADKLTPEVKNTIKKLALDENLDKRLDIPKAEALILSRLEPEKQKPQLIKIIDKYKNVKQRPAEKKVQKTIEEKLINLFEKLDNEHPVDWEDIVNKCITEYKKGGKDITEVPSDDVIDN